MIKVYLNQLEEKANVKLQATDPILQWLIRWVAMAYSRYKLGADGKRLMNVKRAVSVS